MNQNQYHRLLGTIFGAVLLFLTPACLSQPTVPTDMPFVRLNDAVIGRYDTYVIADETLTEEEMDYFLSDSELLGAFLGEEDIPAETFELISELVYTRHDEYVDSDQFLTDAARGVYLTSTYRLRRRLAAVKGDPVPPEPALD